MIQILDTATSITPTANDDEYLCNEQTLFTVEDNVNLSQVGQAVGETLAEIEDCQERTPSAREISDAIDDEPLLGRAQKERILR
jgi:hypothetical protein